MRGLFITFEGGEGAGKSTQIESLAEHLRSAGYNVVVTREPGGSPGAEAVRHVLLSGAAEPLGQDIEAVLFSAARSDHVDQVIRPALKGDEGSSPIIYSNNCINCGRCIDTCPHDVFRFSKRF